MTDHIVNHGHGNKRPDGINICSHLFCMMFMFYVYPLYKSMYNVYWYSTRFPYHTMLVSYICKTTGVTSGTGSNIPFRSTWVRPRYFAQSFVFCVLLFFQIIVFLTIYFWLLHCLSFSDLRLLNTPLLSANISSI